MRDRVNLLPLHVAEGICPLFFPILVEDKHAVAENLRRRGIGVVELWNEGDSEANGADSGDALFLRKHVLELPIHQNVSKAQLDFITREVTRCVPYTERLHVPFPGSTNAPIAGPNASKVQLSATEPARPSVC